VAASSGLLICASLSEANNNGGRFCFCGKSKRRAGVAVPLYAQTKRGEKGKRRASWSWAVAVLYCLWWRCSCQRDGACLLLPFFSAFPSDRVGKWWGVDICGSLKRITGPLILYGSLSWNSGLVHWEQSIRTNDRSRGQWDYENNLSQPTNYSEGAAVFAAHYVDETH
jgi:hypothetical protein